MLFSIYFDTDKDLTKKLAPVASSLQLLFNEKKIKKYSKINFIFFDSKNEQINIIGKESKIVNIDCSINFNKSKSDQNEFIKECYIIILDILGKIDILYSRYSIEIELIKKEIFSSNFEPEIILFKASGNGCSVEFKIKFTLTYAIIFAQKLINGKVAKRINLREVVAKPFIYERVFNSVKYNKEDDIMIIQDINKEIFHRINFGNGDVEIVFENQKNDTETLKKYLKFADYSITDQERIIIMNS